uniref:Uncharacterized protein n=1 Tax=Anopheles atroparvus TaxID=41427 RepID=A0A182JHS5_ANOAO
MFYFHYTFSWLAPPTVLPLKCDGTFMAALVSAREGVLGSGKLLCKWITLLALALASVQQRRNRAHRAYGFKSRRLGRRGMPPGSPDRTEMPETGVGERSHGATE